MQTFVFVTFLIAVCFVCTMKGVKLKHCTNSKLDINANSPGPIICNNITKSGSVIWRHGQKKVLGECTTDGKCSSVFPNEYIVTREANSTDSQLQFLANVTVDDGVEISCEDRQSNTIDTCTLTIKGVEITNCRNNKLVIFENSSQAITCRNTPGNGTIIWRLGADKNYIGQCNALGKCVNNMSASYSISREKDSAEIHLLILTTLRGLVDARFTCEDKSGKTSDTCQLVIRRHPVLQNCTITTNIIRGTVSGHCIVDEFFTSDNSSQCQWTMREAEDALALETRTRDEQHTRTAVQTPVNRENEKTEAEKEGNRSQARKKDADQKQAPWKSHVSFKYTCKGRWSCRGTCSFTSSLPQQEGEYIYTITVLDSFKATLSLNIPINDKKQTKSTNTMLGTSLNPDENIQTKSTDSMLSTPSHLNTKNQTKSTDVTLSFSSLQPDEKNQTKSTDVMSSTSSSSFSSHPDDNIQQISTSAIHYTPSSHSDNDFKTTPVQLLSSSPSVSLSEGNPGQLGLIFGILLTFAFLTTAAAAFVIYRRRKLQRQSGRQQEKNETTQRENDFEEFINDVYQSADPNMIQPFQNT